MAAAAPEHDNAAQAVAFSVFGMNARRGWDLDAIKLPPLFHAHLNREKSCGNAGILSKGSPDVPVTKGQKFQVQLLQEQALALTCPADAANSQELKAKSLFAETETETETVY
ncbi:MAG: hypothetical protein ACR2IF_16960 [Terriglobales bacterium]